MNPPLSSGGEMGIGRDIGEQVRLWVGSGELINLPPQALVNRLLDAAGPSRRLHGPLQDLGRQPLFLQLLHERQPARAHATIQALTAELAAIYSPAVLTELVQLLDAAAGIAGVPPAKPHLDSRSVNSSNVIDPPSAQGSLEVKQNSVPELVLANPGVPKVL